MSKLVSIGTIDHVALTVVMAMSLLLSACKDSPTEWQSKIRKECGKDLVFDVTRFGYFGDDDCWKITCVEMSEKVYHDKIVCLKERN
jgi:hypothetical protein